MYTDTYTKANCFNILFVANRDFRHVNETIELKLSYPRECVQVDILHNKVVSAPRLFHVVLHQTFPAEKPIEHVISIEDSDRKIQN